MSAIARSTLRDTIRKTGGYENVRKFTDAFLNTKIQSAFGKFWQLVAKHHKGYWDTDTTISTTAGTAFKALPTDCWTIRAIDMLDNGGKVARSLSAIGLDSRNKFGEDNGEPCAYRRTSRGIDIYPTPNAVYSLKVYYTPLAPTLDESTTREWYNGWEDYVIECVLLELDKREGRPIGERLAEIERIEKQVETGVEISNAQEPEYLVLREYTDDIGVY